MDIDIVAKFAQFQDSLDKIGRDAEKLNGKFSAAAGALKSGLAGVLAGAGIGDLIGKFREAVKEAIDLGDEFNDLSVRTGLTAQQLLVLKAAAERSGSSMEGLDTLASKIPKVMKEAGDQGSYAARAITALGVDPKQGLTDLYGYLLNVGKGLGQFNGSPAKDALAIAALGKGGDKLIGLVQGLWG